MSGARASSCADDLFGGPGAAFDASPLYTIRTMFDCAICTVPMLGESTVYTPLSMLRISPSMRLPSLSSIVGEASTPEARPSNAAARQASIRVFMDGPLHITWTSILLPKKRASPCSPATWRVPDSAALHTGYGAR